MPSATSPRPHVLILGAGLGGLTLAQSLRKQGVSFEIFERDASLHARSQGWAIALHKILKQLDEDLPDDLPPIETTSHLSPLKLSPEFTIYLNGGYHQGKPSAEKRVLRANRMRLREWLNLHIDVKWGKMVSRIEEHDSKVTLHFNDGTSATGDVLVGADGVRSTVRAHIFDNPDMTAKLPADSLTGEATLDKDSYLRQFALGRSAYIINRDGVRMFIGLKSISEDAESADYYWFYSLQGEDMDSESHWTKKATAHDRLNYVLEHSKSLDPRLTEIVRLTKPEGMAMQTFAMWDMVLTEMPTTRLTLLGDAAHPMAPARGEGGNHALQDALNLGRALGGATADDVVERLGAYQEEMLARGSDAVRKSREAIQDFGMRTVEAFQSWADVQYHEGNLPA